MTEVKIEQNEIMVDIKVKGHAEYNPGNDVVCAAISNNVCTFYSLLLETDLDILKQKILSGYVHIKYIRKDNIMNEYLKFIVRSFKMLEESYPENIKTNICLLEN